MKKVKTVLQSIADWLSKGNPDNKKKFIVSETKKVLVIERIIEKKYAKKEKN